jgi:predicted RNA-binding Zn-ribbon protein involved in translation (DUF1610 family)
VKKLYIYPANKQLISEDMRIDELPAIKIWGRRYSDGREGWFFFSAVKGSYHSVLPDWIQKGDEVEFFEPLAQGSMRSLTLPGIRVAGGSVSRLILEGGNILLFSNIAGVHQSFYLLKPGELDDLHEIIIDTVYMEEPCPQCGSEIVFHHRHAEPAKTFSKCLSCGYDWQGKVQADLILVKKNLERSVAQELERHPHLKELLRDTDDEGEPPIGV